MIWRPGQFSSRCREVQEMPQRQAYLVRRLSEVEEDRSTCGFRKRLITAEDTDKNSFSVVKFSDAQKHYHKRTTEFYYCLEGEGVLELNGDKVPLSPGTLVMIEPMVAHRAVGEVTGLVIGSPPFTPEDQFEGGD
jgi:mannose-6-phosphate isomerase-like protein (cupin superfamily)